MNKVDLPWQATGCVVYKDVLKIELCVQLLTSHCSKPAQVSKWNRLSVHENLTSAQSARAPLWPLLYWM